MMDWGESGGRRIIGIDLAWKDHHQSGCVELAWEGDELRVDRIDTRVGVDAIVEWIEPSRDDWVVAVDAPLIVRNRTGSRQADKDATTAYGRFEAGAYPANLNLLGDDHAGGRLWEALLEAGGQLVERAPQDVKSGSLVFETYPHVAMVEMFELEQTIKYKPGRGVAQQRIGQRQLAETIREHFCDTPAGPKLQMNDLLEDLLCEPDPELKGDALKGREDMLDAVVCAYVAAWLEGGEPAAGLGELGDGVMIVPWVRHLRGRFR